MNVTVVERRAPAKINLTLDVLQRRSDGYHEIRSLAIGVDCHDRVRCHQTSQPGIQIDCADPELRGASNLVVRAARSLADRLKINPSLAIDLSKAIPLGGGMGGGSSDAASTLAACNQLWQAGLDSKELASIGATIGSDVALFFSLPAAMMRGRGEIVEPVELKWHGWVVLVFCGVHVATPEVFAEWKKEDQAKRGDDEDLLTADSAAELGSLLRNDLEPAVFRVCPTLRTVHEQLSSLGIGNIRVSGAGSTLFCLQDSEDAGRNAADRIKSACGHVTVHVAAAPVGESLV